MFKFFITAFFVLSVIASLGQGLESVEQKLLLQINKIEYWRDYQGEDFKIDKYDSLQKANDDFRGDLVRYLSSVPSSLKYNFRKLEEKGVPVASSSDGMFRVYSWDTYTGGTMHYYDNVCQFQSGSKVYSIAIKDKPENGDPGYWYSSVYSIVRGKERFYLVRRHGTYSTKNLYQGFKVFGVEHGALTSARIIKTESGLQSEVGVNYDFFSVAKRKERPVILVTYDSTKKQISFPTVQEDGAVTEKLIRYNFNGQHFVRVH